MKESLRGLQKNKDQRLARLRKDYGFMNRNGEEYKTFADMAKSSQPKLKTTDSTKLLNCPSSKLINQDQRLNYLVLKEGKFKRTDTINQRYIKPRPKNVQRQNPFQTAYTVNSQTKYIWSDKPAPKVSLYNNSGSKHDILNTERASLDSKSYDHESPKKFRKVNGISEFTQTTHAFNPNPNHDYLKIVQNKNAFKKKKGMCSEFVKLAKYNV